MKNTFFFHLALWLPNSW